MSRNGKPQTARARRDTDLPQELADAVAELGIRHRKLAELYSRRIGKEPPVRQNFATHVINGYCACPTPMRRIIEQEINLAKARAALDGATAAPVQSTPEESARK